MVACVLNQVPLCLSGRGGGDVVVFLSCFDMRGEQVQCVGHILIFIAWERCEALSCQWHHYWSLSSLLSVISPVVWCLVSSYCDVLCLFSLSLRLGVICSLFRDQYNWNILVGASTLWHFYAIYMEPHMWRWSWAMSSQTSQNLLKTHAASLTMGKQGRSSLTSNISNNPIRGRRILYYRHHWDLFFWEAAKDKILNYLW